MLLLTSTTDKIQVVTDAAVTLDVHASWLDYASPTFTPGRTNSAISTATTTDVIGAPAASTTRNAKELNIRNTHASTPVGVTVQHVASGGTAVQLFKCSLNAGEELTFVDGIGWQRFDATGALVTIAGIKPIRTLRVTADQAFAAAVTLADITDLTCPVSAGKKYAFEICLFTTNNASTTGSQFAVNGPAATDIIVGELGAVTNSVTAVALGGGTATAINTVIVGQTTGQTAVGLHHIMGQYTPSADGTFAVRATSEIAVAAGLTVKKGSWLRIWEIDN